MILDKTQLSAVMYAVAGDDAIYQIEVQTIELILNHVFLNVHPYNHRDVGWTTFYHYCYILHFVWSSVQEVPFQDQLLEKDGSAPEWQHSGRIKAYLLEVTQPEAKSIYPLVPDG